MHEDWAGLGLEPEGQALQFPFQLMELVGQTHPP